MRPLAWMLLSAALAVASPAGAADTAEAEARALFEDGNAHMEKGRYVEALEKFRAAYAKWANPKILLNIGTTLRQLGRNAEAHEAYERWLALPGADPARVAEVKSALAEIAVTLAVLELRVTASGVRVVVDGRLIGTTDDRLVVHVDPGAHGIRGDRAGSKSAVIDVTVTAGERRVLTLAFDEPRADTKVSPAPPPTAPARSGGGFLDVGTVTAGVGVLALGASAGIVLVARSRYRSALDAHCSSLECDAEGKRGTDDARALAGIATFVFAAGATLTVAGVVLHFALPAPSSKPTGSSTVVHFGMGLSGLSLTGAF